MRVLITGCAGYVGSVLTTALAKGEGVAEIVGLDLRAAAAGPAADRQAGYANQADTAGDPGGRAGGHGIDAVIHCAYHTREPYGAEHERQRRWNLHGARNVFEFALGEPSVRRVTQFSTVSIYGARPENSSAAPFTEDTPVVPADYLYSRQEVEAILRGLYERSDRFKHAIIIRPASSGPTGATWSTASAGWSRPHRTATGDAGRPARLVPAVPPRGRPDRDHIAMFLTTPRGPGLEVFNLAPEDALSLDDHAAFYGKRVLALVPPLLLRAAFADLARHARRLHHAARRGGCSPIRSSSTAAPDAVYGYRYGHSSAEAATAGKGEHAGAAQSLILERRPTLRPRKPRPTCAYWNKRGKTDYGYWRLPLRRNPLSG